MGEYNITNYLIRLPRHLLPFIVSMLKTTSASSVSDMLTLFKAHFEADFWGALGTNTYSVSSILLCETDYLKQCPQLEINRFNCYYLLNLQDYLEALSECEIQHTDNNDTVYANLKYFCNKLQRAYTAGTLSATLLTSDIFNQLMLLLTQYYKGILILQRIMDEVLEDKLHQRSIFFREFYLLQQGRQENKLAFQLKVVPEFPEYIHNLFVILAQSGFLAENISFLPDGLKDEPLEKRFVILTNGIQIPLNTNRESCAVFDLLSSRIDNVSNLAARILETECWRSTNERENNNF